MKSMLSCLLAAGALALAGCSSPHPQSAQEPVRSGTFSFAPAPSTPSAFAEKNSHVQTMVQNAITANLATRHNFTRVARSGNVVVACVVVVGNDVPMTEVDQYLGSAADPKNPDTGSLSAGTLVIDVLDARTHQRLYRNLSTRRFLRDASDVHADRIQSAVDEVLAGLQVADAS